MMKKICLLLMGIVLFSLNVKADMGPPIVANYSVSVSNKNGAACYEMNNNKYVKTSKVLEYGKKAKIAYEIEGKYAEIYYTVSNDLQEGCIVLISDITPTSGQYDVKNTDVTKIDSVKAVILAKGGLNLRKGPSQLYSKIITIPQYSVVTLSYSVGTYWYYALYNGKTGWISGNNQYFGMDEDKVLYSYTDISIYDSNRKVIGTIPKFTEVTDYLLLVQYDGPLYYVNYNGTKGFIDKMPYKVNGKIKLNVDSNLYDGNKIKKKITKGTILEYTIENNSDEYVSGTLIPINRFYIPSEGGIIKLSNTDDNYTIIEDDPLIKKKGFIGEGLFNEEKTEVTPPNEEKEEDPLVIPPLPNSDKQNNTETIIIALLSAIIGALTAVILIKFINSKKNK